MFKKPFIRLIKAKKGLFDMGSARKSVPIVNNLEDMKRIPTSCSQC